jgi:hypothetical protein
MEFYAAMKKNEMLSFAGKWMELENIILSEVSLTPCLTEILSLLPCFLEVFETNSRGALKSLSSYSNKDYLGFFF